MKRQERTAASAADAALEAEFETTMDGLLCQGAGWPGAVAVSGGSDSLALMHLLADWAERKAVQPPVVLTVDHGLRKEARAETQRVIRWAAKRGLSAVRFAWSGVKPPGDIEAQARAARYRLMGGWLRETGLRALFVAHTRDDQAETFLLRLARGSGVDGLAAMRKVAPYPIPGHKGIAVARPLLAINREELRAYLARRAQPWLDDPMNADQRFSRARLRTAWPTLEALGLSKDRLADTAAHLGRAREALDEMTLAVLRRTCRIDNAIAYIDREGLIAAPREIGLRALAGALMVVSGQAYRPRFEQLERLFARIVDDKVAAACTLHGCRIGRAPKAKAAFGVETLEIRPELPRRRARG